MKQLTKVKMPNEEFVKSAFCCLVGSSFHPENKDSMVMVKQILAMIFHNLKISTTTRLKKSLSRHRV